MVFTRIRKAFPADEAFRHAAAHHGLEETAQEIGVAKDPVPGLGEGRVIWHIAFQAETAEPAIREVEGDLLAQTTLGADAETVARSPIIRVTLRPKRIESSFHANSNDAFFNTIGRQPPLAGSTQ